MIRVLRHTCVSQASLPDVHHWSERRDLEHSSLYSLSSSQELALAAGPFELAAGLCWRGSTGTIVCEFEEVPGLCWRSSLSSSESMGFYLLVFAGVLGCLSAVFFPFGVCGPYLRGSSWYLWWPRMISFGSSGMIPLCSWWWSGINNRQILIWRIRRLNLWSLWHLYVRMYSLTRSRPLLLLLSLWWLIIIIFAITHWYWKKFRLGRWWSRMQSLTQCISCAHSFPTICWWWSWRQSWRYTRRTWLSWRLMRFRRRQRL